MYQKRASPHDTTLPLPKVGMPPRLREKPESTDELRVVRRAPDPTGVQTTGRWSLRFAISLCLLLLTLNIALSALFRNDPATHLSAVEPAAAPPPSSERRGGLATYVSPKDTKTLGDPPDPSMLDTPSAPPVPLSDPSTADKPSS